MEESIPRAERLRNLTNRHNGLSTFLGIEPIECTLFSLIENTSTSETLELIPHGINWNSTELNTTLTAISSLEEFDEGVFAKWRVADLPVMFASGFLGTLSSVMLRDYFASLHDNPSGKKGTGRRKTPDGGHSGETIDHVPGNKQPGEFGHRWQHGHDILNPFDLFKNRDGELTDWEQYVKLAEESGTILPPWLKAIYFWTRHLFQDSFSKEGLPLPGHSLLREWINPAKNHELLKILGTIKARACVGTAVTNAVMAGYVWGTEKSFKRVCVEPNYRGFSLMLGANMTNLLCGLLAPPPATSFNWSAIPIIGYYSWQMIKLEKKVRTALNARECQLIQNDSILEDNFQLIMHNDSLINAFGDQLNTFEKEVEAYYRYVMKNHIELKTRILN